MGEKYVPSSKWATRELPIPIDQMAQEYRMAKYPNKQMQILAEQCDTRVCRIAWILARCGLNVDTRKLPQIKDGESIDWAAYWAETENAAVCDRIRQQTERINEVEEMESELVKELARKAEVPSGNSMSCSATLDVPPEEVQENGLSCHAAPAEEIKRLRYIKPKGEDMDIEGMPKKEYEPGEIVGVPGKTLAEVGDHGVYRIVGELWSIYLDKLRERGVKMLGTVEVLKMQDLERIVHEIVEGM